MNVYDVHWFNLDECVYTDRITASSEADAEKIARQKYGSPDKWPAPMCKATRVK